MEYKVLARKYRPQTLNELIGQDILVDTLRGAIEQNRLPHAFMMTGIRGVGKTSTARIIARSLVCTAEDKPTINPCGECDNCVSISQDRHVDIIEIDAASNNSVNDVRELISNVSYAPAMARYKIYIIDEVHMLSNQAWNALLKTLEEPPEHVKFIFATTEIKKVPITILSRCMRFDLLRVQTAELASHFTNIAAKEEIKISDDAALQIAKAAEGSVRDGLSILDQAISSLTVGEELSLDSVSTMLGLADKEQVFNLLELIIAGKCEELLSLFRDIYNKGGNPLQIIDELLEVTHFITQFKVIENYANRAVAAENEINRGAEISQNVEVPYLARLWQMLSKGASEIRESGNQLLASEMVLIRICYASNMPTPADILKKTLNNGGTSQNTTKNTINQGDKPSSEIASIDDLLAICSEKKEFFLRSWLEEVAIDNFNAEQKYIAFSPSATTPKDFTKQLQGFIFEHLAQRWQIEEVANSNAKSIKQEGDEQIQKQIDIAKQHPNVVSILKAHNNASIVKVVNNKKL